MSKRIYHQNAENHVISEDEVKGYVIERFMEVKRTKRIKNLVNFQAANKYMIMVHSQEELKKLGNIVASYKKIPFSEILCDYQKHLLKALDMMPTKKTHSNVIMHIFGHFSKDLTHHEKIIFFQFLENYKNDKITIGKILAEINSIIFKVNNVYLTSQTYFLLYAEIQPETYS